jgi:hypothetical protein
MEGKWMQRKKIKKMGNKKMVYYHVQKAGMNITAGSNYQTTHPECGESGSTLHNRVRVFLLRKRKRKKLKEGRKEKKKKIKKGKEEVQFKKGLKKRN